MAGKPLKLWTRRHTLEAQLRLALGQTCVQISEAIGFAHTTVKQRAVRQDLHAPLSVEVQLGLVDELRRLKALEALLDAETGSAQAKRATDELKALKDQSVPQEAASTMTSIKQIKEMSDAELDAYLESLVPGLETKAVDGVEPEGTRVSGKVSVSNDSADGAEATIRRDELAELVISGRTGRRQDTGRG